MIKYAKKDNFYSIFPMGEIPNDWEELTKEEYDKHFEKTLDELKSDKLAELTSITSKFDNQLVNTDMIIKSSLCFKVNADLRSQLNIHRLISIGTEPVSFIIADNTTVDLSLARSLFETIFLLTLIPVSFGIKTKNLPGRLMSVVTLGPL